MSEVRGQREPDGAPHTLYDSPPGAYAKWPVTASGETFTAWVFKPRLRRTRDALLRHAQGRGA
jgi:hypothetical protein